MEIIGYLYLIENFKLNAWNCNLVRRLDDTEIVLEQVVYLSEAVK